VIVDWIAGLLHALLSPIFALLPTGSVSGWFPGAIGTAQSLAGKVYFADAFLPLHELASLLAAIVSIAFPAIVTYRLANWIYKHIPQLGGFGPGSG